MQPVKWFKFYVNIYFEYHSNPEFQESEFIQQGTKMKQTLSFVFASFLSAWKRKAHNFLKSQEQQEKDKVGALNIS